MNTIFYIEDLRLVPSRQPKRNNAPRIDKLFRGYYSSLTEAENAIKVHADYPYKDRLGFYVNEYQINPKPEKYDSQIRKYLYSVDGEQISAYFYDDPFEPTFAGTDSKWKVGDTVLFLYLGRVLIGHIVRIPHTKQWFAEHADEIKQFYNHLHQGEIDDLEFGDWYKIMIDGDNSIFNADSASVFPVPEIYYELIEKGACSPISIG